MESPFPLPVLDERTRLAALASFGVLDTPPEPAFDALVAAAAEVAGMPTALVSLVDADRQWFKARCGLDVGSTGRDVAFCDHVVRAGRELEVPDACADPRFAGNPLVTGAPHIRSYAGFPLRTPAGAVLGTLCVIGYRPQALTDPARRVLRVLADQVLTQLELRRRLAVQDTMRVDLADSERRYRLLAENATDVISRHGPDGTVLYVSPSVLTVLGRNPRDELGAPAPDRVDPRDRHLLGAAMAAVAGGQSGSVTVRSQHADGSWRWLEITLSPVRDGAGELVEVHSAARDVTAREEAMRALAVSEARMAGLLEHSSSVIYAKDLEGRFVLANPALGAVVGRPLEQILGRTEAQLFTPEHADALRDDDLAVLSAGVAQVVEETVPHPDGEIHHYLTTKFPLFDEDGEAFAVAGISTDVSHLRAADRARAESETRYRKLVEQLPDAIIVQVEGVVTFANPEAAVLFGTPASEDLLGLALAAHMDPAHDRHSSARTRTLLEGGRVPTSRERLQRLAGDWATVDVTASRIEIDGRVGIQMILRDVSAQESAAEALRASEQRFRAAFVDGPTPMAHLHADGSVQDANAALRRFLSLPSRRLVGRAITELVHVDDRELLAAALRGPGTGSTPIEARFLRADGVTVWCELATTLGTGPDGTPYVLAQLVDVHARKQNELLLERAALHDRLTGAANRRVLDDRLAELLDVGSGPGALLLFADLDGFKAINDTYGHDAGDAVLVEVARRLLALVRPGDYVVRLGGDEFVVLCPRPANNPTGAATALAERVRNALRAPVLHGGIELLVGVSVGTSIGEPGDLAGLVLESADRSMYARKQSRQRELSAAAK